MRQNWYVLHTKPNHEALLAAQLQARGLEVYFPRLRVRPVNPRSRHEIPYFPGYLFVQFELENTPLASIAWLPGMQRIVAFDGEPACVPEQLILALRQKVQAANLVCNDPFSALQHGQKVTLERGPFAGYEAIFDTRVNGSERARVLLSYLHTRQMCVEVPVSQLCAVQA